MSDKILKLTQAQTLYQDLRERIDALPTDEDITVTDVQVNGTSVVQDGVANLPLASSSTLGVVKAGSGYGVTINANGYLVLSDTTDNVIKAGESRTRAIMPYIQHSATFYGLAKAAGDSTQAASNNAVGTYTNEAKSAIRAMLGAVGDVQINGTSAVNNSVANISIADSDTFGVIKVETTGAYGIKLNSNKQLFILNATYEQVKAGGTNWFNPIVPSTQHYAAFYGLAKAAGYDEKNSAQSLGTYTDGAKAAIQNMLGITSLLAPDETSKIASKAYAINDIFITDGKLYKASEAIAKDGAIAPEVNCTETKASEVFVKNTDYATASTAGVIKIDSTYGFYLDNGKIKFLVAGDSAYKEGTSINRVILTSKQHVATFYGLAKAAGDTTQAVSDNAVGTYTTDAKNAIQTMLGVPGDVQINGMSIVSNGVANIPIGDSSNLGVVKAGSSMQIYSSGSIEFRAVGAGEVKAGASYTRALTPERQHASVFYGLAKAAGADMASSSNAIGTYTETAKAAIQNMLGISSIIGPDETSLMVSKAYSIGECFTVGGKLYRATAALAQNDTPVEGTNCEQINIIEDFVKKTDYASYYNAGVIKTDTMYGTSVTNGYLRIYEAEVTDIKGGAKSYRPITPNRQHYSIFYGLSKLAGLDLANEEVTFGTYPETSKTAIRSLIGAAAANDIPNVPVQDVQVNGTSILSNGIATIPTVTYETLGLVKTNSTNGIAASTGGYIYVYKPTDEEITGGVEKFRPIVPCVQHQSVFYGLAKAAGSDEKDSTLPVGTYTETAKSKIQSMLGIEAGVSLVENVSGTTPSIIGLPNVRYVCGEVSSISITPPAMGSVEVIFESGTTPAVLTVPNTIKWPEWFDDTSLAASTVYRMIITDAKYGAVISWAS